MVRCFRFRNPISRKQYEIKNVSSLLCRQCYACCDETAEARNAVFTIKQHYTSAVCILSLTTKLKWNPFEFNIISNQPTSKVELTSRFTQYLQLDVTVTVTQIHGSEGVTNINYGTEVWTTECFFVDADLQNIMVSPIDGVLGYFCIFYFHYL